MVIWVISAPFRLKKIVAMLNVMISLDHVNITVNAMEKTKIIVS